MLRGDLACPGVRVGRVAAYEFDIPEHLWVRPGAGRRQRVFLLLDESIQLNQPVIYKENRAGWWYVDLVEIDERGDIIGVRDRYVDFLVGPPELPYRVLDLDELGDAMLAGILTPTQAADVLTAAQTFADRYLQRKGDYTAGWPDFPPAALEPLRDITIPAS